MPDTEFARRLIRRAREVAFRGGAVEAIRVFGRRFRAFLWCTNCSIWYERTLATKIPCLTQGAEIQAKVIDREKNDFLHWLKHKHKDFPWIYIEKEISVAEQSGHIFVVLYNLETIIGYIKVGVNQVYIHDFQTIVNFPQGSAFVYDTFVLPDYRGNNLALFALCEAMSYLKKNGYERVLCHIEKWNYPSIKTFKSANFSPVGKIRYMKLLGFGFYIKDQLAPMRKVDSFISRVRTQ